MFKKKMDTFDEEEEEEEDNDLDADSLVIARNTQKYVETLRKFFIKKGNKNCPYDIA